MCTIRMRSILKNPIFPISLRHISWQNLEIYLRSLDLIVGAILLYLLPIVSVFIILMLSLMMQLHFLYWIHDGFRTREDEEKGFILKVRYVIKRRVFLSIFQKNFYSHHVKGFLHLDAHIHQRLHRRNIHERHLLSLGRPIFFRNFRLFMVKPLIVRMIAREIISSIFRWSFCFSSLSSSHFTVLYRLPYSTLMFCIVSEMGNSDFSMQHDRIRRFSCRYHPFWELSHAGESSYAGTSLSHEKTPCTSTILSILFAYISIVWNTPSLSYSHFEASDVAICSRGGSRSTLYPIRHRLQLCISQSRQITGQILSR